MKEKTKTVVKQLRAEKDAIQDKTKKTVKLPKKIIDRILSTTQQVVSLRNQQAKLKATEDQLMKESSIMCQSYLEGAGHELSDGAEINFDEKTGELTF